MKVRKFADFLVEDPRLGLTISGTKVREPINNPARTLKYYSVNSETDTIIDHNRGWAMTGSGIPRFQFFYIMLPTPCNQRCVGCFTGQDKGRLPPALTGPYYSATELDRILEVATDHGVKALVYSGGGELFAWESAFSFINRIVDHGLGMVIFTNGTLLSPMDIAHLNTLGVALIVSLRDTIEAKHNTQVGCPHFRLAVETIGTCLQLGMQNDSRLAVEMPVTTDNENRALNDLLPVCRALGIVPWIEEFIRTSISPEERAACHNFEQARCFFQRAALKDAELGISWGPEYGTRMIDQPQCRRPLYSLAIYPSGEVLDCTCPTDRPSISLLYGNMRETPLEDIIQSERFRQRQLNYQYCPCSLFYTHDNHEIPRELPPHLKGA